MIYFRILFLSVFLVFTYVMKSQTNGLGFIYPIDREPVITGNYGELRPNHFHAGIDFSTDPIKNLPIKSIADGYVSRIKISSVGYGKVLYITHPNGYVSVYAHQKQYAPKIDAYIKAKQIEAKKNEIEIYPTKNELPVTKGEIVGFTGNSGRSSGPHLHFEIRDEKSEVPLNPLLFYSVADNVKPTVTHIAIYNTTDTNNINRQQVIPINTKGAKAAAPQITLKQNTFALAFAGYDAANATTNKNNIYEAKLLLDNKLIYHHQLNQISFDNGRYVNYFSEKAEGVKLQKCFTPVCYDNSMYVNATGGGKIVLNDTLLHDLKLVVADERGNSNEYTFKVKSKNIAGYTSSKQLVNANCNKDVEIKKEDIEVYIKSGTLVKPTFVSAYYNKLGKLSVGNSADILLKAVTIKFKVNNIKSGKENKLVVLNDDNSLPATYNNGWLSFETKNFGLFSLAYDTVAPTIKWTRAKKKQFNVSDANSLSFKVNDHLSGVGEYHVYINNSWQIAEYDAKNDLIICYFDAKTPKGKLDVRVEVFDKVGNKAEYKFVTSR